MQHRRAAQNKLRKESVVAADSGGTHAHSVREYLNFVRHFGTYKAGLYPQIVTELSDA